MSDELIIVGRVRKTHGVRGDLVIEPLTDDDTVFTPGRCLIAGTASGDPAKERRELHVTAASPFKGGYIVHFEELSVREVADNWRGRYLLLPAAELTPLADDQVYVHELPGMRVELESGEVVGVVDTIYELPQGITLDVKRPTGSVLIPYDRVVTHLDREARVMRISPPHGLLDS